MLAHSNPLLARQPIEHSAAGLTISTAEDCARFVLRIDPARLALAEKAFGCSLPEKIGSMVTSKEHRAICLGPDEWLLHAPTEQAGEISGQFDELYADCIHSLVEISDREVGMSVSGPKAALAINSNCPRDLDQIHAGSAIRTIFDSTPITLIKTSETDYRIEVWRSFADHVWDLLASAAKEINLDV